jgi:hypothetical protein
MPSTLGLFLCIQPQPIHPIDGVIVAEGIEINAAIFGNRIAGEPPSGQTVKEPVAKVVKPGFIVKIFRLPTESSERAENIFAKFSSNLSELIDVHFFCRIRTT